MGLYRNISINFWNDSKIDDDFTPEDKYFYLYLITNPHTNICGCYEIGKKQMERETGYTWDTIAILIERMQNVHNVIRYDDKNKEILILNWGKYNWSRSEKVRTAVYGVSSGIKTKGFKEYIRNRIDEKVNYSSENKADTSISDNTDNTDIHISDKTDIHISGEQEIESDTVTGGYGMHTISDKPKCKRFVPPSLDEVKNYCSEKGYNIDPEQFIDFYSSNGWKVGKNQMKDWKAAVRTWNKRQSTEGKKTGSAYIDAINHRYDVIEEWLEGETS